MWMLLKFLGFVGNLGFFDVWLFLFVLKEFLGIDVFFCIFYIYIVSNYIFLYMLELRGFSFHTVCFLCFLLFCVFVFDGFLNLLDMCFL